VLPELSPGDWTLVALAAAGIGIAKSGFSGFSLIQITIFAAIFNPTQSLGLLLPLLIVGDISAVTAFRRHARWEYIRRLLPPAIIGIVAGWWLLGYLDDLAVKRMIGGIVLSLALLQGTRMWKPNWFNDLPHSRWFALTLGLLTGLTTMLANAAGPIVAIYLVAVGLPKYEFVGTSAWFFLIANVFKIPFSTQLGLIRPDTLMLNLVLAPAVVIGLLVGRKLVHYVPQRLFDTLLLTFAAIAGLKLVGAFETMTAIYRHVFPSA
jgi:uncharacterized membrane protein YfcA